MLTTEVAQFLDEAGLGTYDAGGIEGDIFVETLPETPDACIAVYATGGPAPPGYEPYETPTIQVIVRGGQDPREPQAVAQAIYETLHGLKDQPLTAGGTWVIGTWSLASGPAHIGQDANRRHEYSLNFRLYIENENRRPDDGS